MYDTDTNIGAVKANYAALWEKRQRLLDTVGEYPRFNTSAGWCNDAQLALDRARHDAAVAARQKRLDAVKPALRRIEPKLLRLLARLRAHESAAARAAEAEAA